MMLKNREEAGELLAKKLSPFLGDKNSVILGVTRGGVVVAGVVAKRLNLPLDIIVIKKISLPQERELAIGAVGPKDSVYWYKSLCKRLKLTKSERLGLKSEKEREQKEQEKRLRAVPRSGISLRERRLPLSLRHKTIILVDDGVATGASAICSSLYLKQEEARRIILATPMISKDTLSYINRYFDDIFFLNLVDDFFSVGQFYEDFHQVSDGEVIKILEY